MKSRLPILIAVFLLLPMVARAQQVAGIDQLLQQFQNATNAWNGPILGLMYGTFGSLAVIDLVFFVGVRTAMSHGNVSDFIYALVGETIFLSFFFWLMTTFNVTGPLIIQGFRRAAQQIGGIPMQPNGIFAEGLKIATTITHQVSILHPADAVAMVICGLIVLGCFAWIVGTIVIVLVESYFIVSAGQIMLMFGGSHFTYDKAVNLIWTCVGIGLKLYVLQLIASVGAAFIAAWVAAPAQVTFDNIFIEIGLTLILAVITGGVPHMFERMAGGIGTSGAGGLVAAGGMLAGAATMMGKTVASAVTGAIGVGSAGAAAGRLASSQMAIGGGGPTSSAGRAAAMIGSTASNMASAKVADVVRGLSGQRSNLGQSSFRMAADLTERNRLLNESQNRP